MARNRQRAKQRRDRARRSTGGATAVDRAARQEPLPADAAEEGALSGAEADDTSVAPDPLEHASADVDLANAQLAAGAAGAPEAAVGTELEDSDGVELAPDELEEEADVAATPSRRRRAAQPRDEELEREAASVATRPRRRTPDRSPNAGRKVLDFLMACWRELQRVQWPDRRQVVQATGVVIGFVFVAGLYLGLADAVFSRLVDAIL